MPKLSDRLKYIRQSYGLSQDELAAKAGTTQQAIQQAEKGKARQPRYLHNLANALEIDVEWVIFGTVEGAVKPIETQNDGLEDSASDVLNKFYAMPEKDQELIYELMKSRQQSEEK